MTTREIWLYAVLPAACVLAVLTTLFVLDKRRVRLGARTPGFTRARIVAVLLGMEAVDVVLDLISGDSIDWAIRFIAAAVILGSAFFAFWLDGVIARRFGFRPFTNDPE